MINILSTSSEIGLRWIPRGTFCVVILKVWFLNSIDDSKVHGANMGPIWADRTQVGPMLAPWTLVSGKALPEPMLTQTYVYIWCDQATLS